MGCKCKNQDCVPKRGERGLRGNDGLQGPSGVDGPEGPQGPAGADGTPAIVYPSMVSFSRPLNVPVTPPGINSARLCDAGAVVQIMGEVIDDNGSYNPITGVWTCMESGYYDFNFWVQLSDDDGLGIGKIMAGILFADGSCNTAVAGESAINQLLQKHCSITGTNNMQYIAQGAQYVLRTINVTTKAYVSKLGDVAKMTITRVR